MKAVQILYIILIVLTSCTTILKTSPTVSKPIIVNVDTLNPEKMRNDTIRYLQTEVVNKKQKYIGQPVELLLKDLKYEVKYYIVSTTMNVDPKKEIVRGLTVIFHSQKEYYQLEDRYDDARVLTISLKTTITYDEVMPLLNKYNGNWSQEIREYYGKQIVSDVVVPGLLLK